jgi:hypothetical protein
LNRLSAFLKPVIGAARYRNAVLSCGVGNHVDLRGLPDAAEGIRIDDDRGRREISSYSTSQASFCTLPASFLGGAAAAAGIALVNSLGNIAGFASTYVVGWMADLTHSNVTSLFLFAGIVSLGGILVLMIPASLVNR